YVSTIANGGTRYAPRVVKGIYGNSSNGELGKEKELMQPKVMSKIEGREKEFEIIQEGMYQVVNGPMGTGTSLQGASLPIAAKTGTAETFAVDPKSNKSVSVINSTIVGYAPYNDPKVAVSVMIPQISDDDMGTNRIILKEVINAYNEEFNKQ
ncbi:MAG TPA: penicillin-binding transpeptidase domain-containing protein, partial [Tissierellaceae bacterium]